jgi:type II secretory pathway component PulM
MSAQTPQTVDDALIDAIADSLAAAGKKVTRYPLADQAKVERLEAERDHYKALCEELKGALQEIAKFNTPEADRPSDHADCRAVARAALKKAKKDI